MIQRANEKPQAVTIRFPKRVLARAGTAAKRNGRSRNTEIVMAVARGLGMKGAVYTRSSE